MRYLLLSLDAEEFDLPIEYGLDISVEKQHSITRLGLEKALQLLKGEGVSATLFTTALFAAKNRGIIKQARSEGHEIALHGYRHDHNYRGMNEEASRQLIRKGKAVLEGLANAKVIGFRAPRLMTPGFHILRECGIRYDSSLHPTLVPGRYNNLFRSRSVYSSRGIIEIPISTTPVIRLPFSWLWFRNLGVGYAEACTLLSLIDLDYVNIYFHPWELVSLSEFEGRLPRSIIRGTGNGLLRMLRRYLRWCMSRGIKPLTISCFLQEKGLIMGL
ncbi:hypothetical protein COT48_05555 [Candidatus Woesearchaeota archaeon CG08_land_8_20_14_0_20_47_9]|nr:MAG: hypothetical protein COT48_05555 [Candidatus Woesearchaeota archaeon CG08_land_8_20_14_0_20_47_9]